MPVEAISVRTGTSSFLYLLRPAEVRQVDDEAGGEDVGADLRSAA